MRPKQSRPEGGLGPRSLRLRSRAASLPKLRVQNGVRCWMNNGKHLLALSFSAFDPSATLAVHCVEGLDADLFLYQSARQRR